MLNRLSISTKLGLLEWFYWAYQASFKGYVAALALHLGFSQTFISLNGAVYAIVFVISLPCWNRLMHRMKSKRQLLAATKLVMLVMTICMSFAKAEAVFMLCYAVLSFFESPCYAVTDSLVLSTIHDDPNIYGKIRAWGAASYAIVMLLMGYAISFFGYGVMTALSIVHGLLFVAVLTSIPEQAKPVPEKRAIQSREKGAYGELFRVRSYWPIALVMLLLGLGLSPINSLKIVMLQSLGGSVSTQGIDSFFACVVQTFSFFFAYQILKKVKPGAYLILCTAGMLLGVLLDCLATAPWMMICGSIMISAAYSLIVPSVRLLTARLLPESMRMLGNATADIMYGSVAGIFSLLYAGRLAEVAGVRALLMLGLFFVLVAMAVSVGSKRQIEEAHQQAAAHSG